MAKPQAKKQKTSNDPTQPIKPLEPIVFTHRKAKPDIRFFVFDQVYHVYSGVLKISSEFFQSFLEPSGGLVPTSSSPDFRSDWHTKFEEDGSWHLSSDPDLVDVDHKLVLFKGDEDLEKRAFYNLLLAMFNRPYEVTDVGELMAMTKQADYYGALCTLSNTLDGAIGRSPGLLSSLGTDPCGLLVSASKLRHKSLFRESFIRSLGPWSKPRYKELEPGLLHTIVESAYTKLAKDVDAFWRNLPQVAANSPEKGHTFNFNTSGLDLTRGIFNRVSNCLDTDKRVIMPKLFREAHDKVQLADWADDAVQYLRSVLSPFLKNNLAISDRVVAGQDAFENYFLCFEIQDEDLPWDITETDW